jgi:hypothetical protein
MIKIKYLMLFASFSATSAVAEKLVDPTRPIGYSASIAQAQVQQAPSADQQWTLNTTLISPYQKIAMINGKRLKVGDDINGAKVIMIDHQKVDLRREGRLFTIKLHNSFISKINPGSE